MGVALERLGAFSLGFCRFVGTATDCVRLYASSILSGLEKPGSSPS